MTIKKPSRNELRFNREEKEGRPMDHRTEKHFRNAFKPRNFNPTALTAQEADELGVDERGLIDDESFALDFLDDTDFE
jgi:hypothetical protein